MKKMLKLLPMILLVLLAAPNISCDNTQKKYDVLITKADKDFTNKAYDAALKSYTGAAELMPEEKYPAEKILEIKKILAEQKAAESYNKEIKKADEYYDNGKFETALKAYTRARSYKPDEAYPKGRIDEIEAMLAENVPVAESAPEGRYHIIVGSFEVEDHALKLQEKLKEQGMETKLVSREGGRYTAVILRYYPNVHEAFNHLIEARTYTGHAWVLYHRF